MDTVTQPKVEISFAGALVTIPEATIAELWLQRARLKEAPQSTEAQPLHIGAVVNGQTYMGVVRGDAGPDYRLWDLGESAERLNHTDATKWAEYQGGSLPTRREQSIMFGNRADGQYKAEWYWSSEQFAGAWVQTFGGGGQSDDRKSDGYHARAVRREVIH